MGRIMMVTPIAAPTVALSARTAPAAPQEAFGVGARAILSGGVAVYVVSISFTHRLSRRSLEDRVLFVCLGVAAALICLAIFGSRLPPLALVGLLALAMGGLTTFEILLSGHLPDIQTSNSGG